MPKNKGVVTMDKLRIAWIKFKLLFIKKPRGISYKGIVYLNKAAIKAFESNDKL